MEFSESIKCLLCHGRQPYRDKSLGELETHMRKQHRVIFFIKELFQLSMECKNKEDIMAKQVVDVDIDQEVFIKDTPVKNRARRYTGTSKTNRNIKQEIIDTKVQVKNLMPKSTMKTQIQNNVSVRSQSQFETKPKFINQITSGIKTKGKSDIILVDEDEIGEGMPVYQNKRSRRLTGSSKADQKVKQEQTAKQVKQEGINGQLQPKSSQTNFLGINVQDKKDFIIVDEDEIHSNMDIIIEDDEDEIKVDNTITHTSFVDEDENLKQTTGAVNNRNKNQQETKNNVYFEDDNIPEIAEYVNQDEVIQGTTDFFTNKEENLQEFTEINKAEVVNEKHGFDNSKDNILPEVTKLNENEDDNNQKTTAYVSNEDKYIQQTTDFDANIDGGRKKLNKFSYNGVGDPQGTTKCLNNRGDYLHEKNEFDTNGDKDIQEKVEFHNNIDEFLQKASEVVKTEEENRKEKNIFFNFQETTNIINNIKKLEGLNETHEYVNEDKSTTDNDIHNKEGANIEDREASNFVDDEYLQEATEVDVDADDSTESDEIEDNAKIDCSHGEIDNNIQETNDLYVDEDVNEHELEEDEIEDRVNNDDGDDNYYENLKMSTDFNNDEDEFEYNENNYECDGNLQESNYIDKYVTENKIKNYEIGEGGKNNVGDFENFKEKTENETGNVERNELEEHEKNGEIDENLQKTDNIDENVAKTNIEKDKSDDIQEGGGKKYLANGDIYENLKEITDFNNDEDDAENDESNELEDNEKINFADDDENLHVTNSSGNEIENEDNENRKKINFEDDDDDENLTDPTENEIQNEDDADNEESNELEDNKKINFANCDENLHVTNSSGNEIENEDNENRKKINFEDDDDDENLMDPTENEIQNEDGADNEESNELEDNEKNNFADDDENLQVTNSSGNEIENEDNENRKNINFEDDDDDDENLTDPTENGIQNEESDDIEDGEEINFADDDEYDNLQEENNFDIDEDATENQILNMESENIEDTEKNYFAYEIDEQEKMDFDEDATDIVEKKIDKESAETESIDFGIKDADKIEEGEKMDNEDDMEYCIADLLFYEDNPEGLTDFELPDNESLSCEEDVEESEIFASKVDFIENKQNISKENMEITVIEYNNTKDNSDEVHDILESFFDDQIEISDSESSNEVELSNKELTSQDDKPISPHEEIKKDPEGISIKTDCECASTDIKPTISSLASIKGDPENISTKNDCECGPVDEKPLFNTDLTTDHVQNVHENGTTSEMLMDFENSTIEDDKEEKSKDLHAKNQNDYLSEHEQNEDLTEINNGIRSEEDNEKRFVPQDKILKDQNIGKEELKTRVKIVKNLNENDIQTSPFHIENSCSSDDSIEEDYSSDAGWSGIVMANSNKDVEDSKLYLSNELEADILEANYNKYQEDSSDIVKADYNNAQDGDLISSEIIRANYNKEIENDNKRTVDNIVESEEWYMAELDSSSGNIMRDDDDKDVDEELGIVKTAEEELGSSNNKKADGNNDLVDKVNEGSSIPNIARHVDNTYIENEELDSTDIKKAFEELDASDIRRAEELELSNSDFLDIDNEDIELDEDELDFYNTDFLLDDDENDEDNEEIASSSTNLFNDKDLNNLEKDRDLIMSQNLVSTKNGNSNSSSDAYSKMQIASASSGDSNLSNALVSNDINHSKMQTAAFSGSKNSNISTDAISDSKKSLTTKTNNYADNNSKMPNDFASNGCNDNNLVSISDNINLELQKGLCSNNVTNPEIPKALISNDFSDNHLEMSNTSVSKSDNYSGIPSTLEIINDYLEMPKSSDGIKPIVKAPEKSSILDEFSNLPTSLFSNEIDEAFETPIEKNKKCMPIEVEEKRPKKIFKSIHKPKETKPSVLFLRGSDDFSVINKASTSTSIAKVSEKSSILEEFSNLPKSLFSTAIDDPFVMSTEKPQKLPEIEENPRKRTLPEIEENPRKRTLPEIEENPRKRTLPEIEENSRKRTLPETDESGIKKKMKSIMDTRKKALEEKRKFKCDNCDKMYVTKGILKTHVISYCKGFKARVCKEENCDSSFDNIYDLNVHEETHKKNKIPLKNSVRILTPVKSQNPYQTPKKTRGENLRPVKSQNPNLTKSQSQSTKSQTKTQSPLKSVDQNGKPLKPTKVQMQNLLQNLTITKTNVQIQAQTQTGSKSKLNIPCTQDGCTQMFQNASQLRDHEFSAHLPPGLLDDQDFDFVMPVLAEPLPKQPEKKKGKAFTCFDCGKSFSSEHGKKVHKSKMH